VLDLVEGAKEGSIMLMSLRLTLPLTLPYYRTFRPGGWRWFLSPDLQEPIVFCRAWKIIKTMDVRSKGGQSSYQFSGYNNLEKGELGTSRL